MLIRKSWEVDDETIVAMLRDVAESIESGKIVRHQL